jgi:hypothetical protein
MSFKKWSSALTDTNKAKSDEKSKVAAIAAQPVATAETPDKAPIKVAPAPKS